MDVKVGLSHEEIWDKDFSEKVMRRMEWIYLEILTDSRRKLRNDQFHDLWPWPSIIIIIITLTN